MLKQILFTCLLFLGAVVNQSAHAQKNLSISGNIKDAKNGEELIGASIAVPALKTGVTTNAYGFYSLSLPPGTYKVEISYVGYETQIKEITLNQNLKLNIELKESKKELKELNQLVKALLTVTDEGGTVNADSLVIKMLKVKINKK